MTCVPVIRQVKKGMQGIDAILYEKKGKGAQPPRCSFPLGELLAQPVLAKADLCHASADNTAHVTARTSVPL